MTEPSDGIEFVKIAQVTPRYLPHIGGVETAVSRLSEELATNGHEVHVFTADGGFPLNEVVNGVHVHRFPVMVEIGRFSSLWPGFLLNLHRGSFDVIHAHVYRHPHSTLLMLRSLSSKANTVISTHGPFHPTRVWGRLAPIVRLYDVALGPGLNLFSMVLIQSQFERDLLAKMHVREDKIRLLPNGVDRSHFTRNDPSSFCDRHEVSQGYLCYLGRLHPTKGLEFLLSSFANMCKKRKNGILLIAGAGEKDYEEYLRAYASRLGIEANLQFLGHLAENDKMALLEGCSALVLPAMYEPYGIVALEAMAHAKPVITTYPGGIQDIVKDGHNGFLVRYGDVEGLSRSMSILIGDPALAARQGSNGQQIASTRTWDRVGHLLENIYLALVS